MEIRNIFFNSRVIWLAILMLSLFHSVTGQELNEKNGIKEQEMFYLMGMIDDYGGHIIIPEHGNLKYRITYFFSGQKKTLDGFKRGLSKAGFEINDFEFEEGDSPNSIVTIYSKKNYKIFNSFFRFKKAKYPYTDEKDNDYIFFIGKLKKKKFKTIESKLNFLKGAFLKHGEKNENGTYELNFSNSLFKYDICKNFLKDTDSKIIESHSTNETIPTGQKLIFNPSLKLKKIID